MRLAFFLSVILLAGPARATGGIAIPEPSDLGLFALAVAGLIVGRSLSRRPPSGPDEEA